MLQGMSWGNQWDYWGKFNQEGTGGYHVLDHRVMFDGPTKTIWILEGIDYINVKQHLYSDWKEWSLLYDHTKFLPAFQTEGGRPISDTERLGDTYLLINDWVIRQREGELPVTIDGNLYAYDSNDEPKDPYLPDVHGDISINSKVSNLVNTISVGGGTTDPALIAAAVWNSLKASYLQAGSMGEQMSAIPTVTQIVDGVLEEPALDHNNAGTVGEKINEIGTTNIDYQLVANAVWDEPISAHTDGGTFGKKLRNIAEDTIWAGAAGDVVTATVNTVTVGDGIAEYSGAYDPAVLYITEGTGVGQCREILQYDWSVPNSQGTFVVDRNWRILPDDTSVLIVVASAGREHVNEGLARGGSVDTITLNATASDDDNDYNGQIVFIRSGAGDDQARRVASYNGTTKVATVTRNWSHPPDNTSAYVMLPTGALSYQCIQEAVYNADASLYKDVGTKGEEGYLAHEEARRARAMATNKVDISRIGTGDSQLDTITVYDDDGVTILYTITVTGDDADNRQVTYTKPY